MADHEYDAFVTVIGCIDGRAARAIDEYVKSEYGAYADMVTTAGMDKHFLTPESKDCAAVRQDVLVSIEAHDSSVVFVTAHDECAGNPVERSEHLRCVAKGIEMVKSWNLGDNITYVGLWVNKKDDEWTAHPIAREEIDFHLEETTDQAA